MRRHTHKEEGMPKVVKFKSGVQYQMFSVSKEFSLAANTNIDRLYFRTELL